MGAAEKELEPLTDRAVVDRYLRYAVDFKEVASCTSEGAPAPITVFTARLLDFQPSAFTLNLEIDEDPYADLNFEQRASLDLAERPLRLAVSVGDVLFFVHARVIARAGRKLGLALDLPVMKLQRRDAVRIKLTKEHGAGVALSGKKFIPHDISASGVGIVMDKQEKELYPKGRSFENVTMHFSGREFRAGLEATGAHPLRKDSDRLWKVGFRFVGLPAAAADSIAREAILYTQRIWSRWL